MPNTIKVIRGDTYTIQQEFTNKETGEAIDVSSNTFWFTVKEKFTDADVSAKIQKTGPDFSISTNKVTLVLSATDTKITPGSYWYDFQYKTPSGAILTVVRGDFIVGSEVTISG